MSGETSWKVAFHFKVMAFYRQSWLHYPRFGDLQRIPGLPNESYGVVCRDALAVTLRFESLLEDEIAIGMEGNHDILVTGACSEGEAASVVGKELAEWFCDNRNLVGRRCNGRRQNR